MSAVGRAAWSLKVLFSHWTSHPTQLVTLLVGLMLATALWSGVQAINAQARSSYDRAAAMFGGGGTAMLVPTDDLTLPQSLFAELRRAGWPVSPVLEGSVRLGGRQFKVIGIEPVSLPRGAGPAPNLDDAVALNFLAPAGQTLVAPDTAADLRAPAGAVMATDSGERLPPISVAADVAPSLLVMDIAHAQRVLSKPGRISRLLLEAGFVVADRPLQRVAGDRLRLVEAGAETELQRLTASFHMNLTAFGLLSFVVGLFIVHAAIGLAFEQRLPMLRTLRACGVSARTVSLVMVAELVLLAALAGTAGVVCGYFIASALLPDVAASLRGLYGAGVSGQLVVTPQWWLAALAMSLLGALAAAASALFKVLRLPLLVSAQPVAWQAAQQRWLRWQAAIAALIMAFAAAMFVWGENLLAGFAMQGGLQIAAALLLPLGLALVLGVGERASRNVVTRWAWADSRRQLSGLSLALMALLLALSVNVGVGTMVGSFEAAFYRWLDGRLASEIYVSARDGTQADQIEAWLRRRTDVNDVLRSASGETMLGGETVELFGLPDHPTYRQQWPLLQSSADAWDSLRAGESVFASEQLSRRLKLGIGDAIRVPARSGEWRVRVAAVYADYGNPKGQLLANVDQLVQRFPDVERRRFGIRTASDHVPALMAELETRFNLGANRLIDQATAKRDARRVFNRTFAVTAALNVFILGVAGIALFTSLLTLGQARLPHVAPLWAMGMTRRQIALLEFAKTMALAAITALLALPLGIVVAWCLIEVVNVRAFGWRLPLQVFPDQLAKLLLVAMLAAGIAALLPAVRLSRLRPVTILKLFADER